MKELEYPFDAAYISSVLYKHQKSFFRLPALIALG